MKNLLLGNGLNIACDNNYLNTDNIKERFFSNLYLELNTIKELLYLENIDYEKILKFIGEEKGIEQISGKVFKYFYNELIEKSAFSWNDCYRLIEILGQISIQSIFVVNKQYKIPYINEKYKKKIAEYDNVYTLNYVESWDDNTECHYLHGNINKYLKKYSGEYITTNILNANKFIADKNKEKIVLDLTDVIFIPDNPIVDKMCYVGEGLYINKCELDIYPSEDIFPYGGKGDIYSKLDSINGLEIFGVSPFGDKSLLKKISKIPNIKIYVYKMIPEEIEEWEKYISNAEFFDSSHFLNTI